MASLNKVMLIGNLGKDPEIKHTPSGLQVGNFSLATTDRVKKGDDYEDKTEWHYITVFGKSAEFAGKYLKKGNTAHIEGRIQTSSWDDDNGVKKYKTVIVADKIQSLTKKTETNSEQTDDSEHGQQEPASDISF